MLQVLYVKAFTCYWKKVDYLKNKNVVFGLTSFKNPLYIKNRKGNSICNCFFRK